MSKQLVLKKIDHIEKELKELRNLALSLGIKEDNDWKGKFWHIANVKYGIDYERLTAKGKSEPIVFVRQIYAYLLTKKDFLTDKEVAKKIKRERSVVVTSRQSVINNIKTKDEKFMRVYNNFKSLAK